jgi:hypothetical protein
MKELKKLFNQTRAKILELVLKAFARSMLRDLIEVAENYGFDDLAKKYRKRLKLLGQKSFCGFRFDGLFVGKSLCEIYDFIKKRKANK